MSHVQYVTAAHICYTEHSLVVFYAFEIGPSQASNSPLNDINEELS